MRGDKKYLAITLIIITFIGILFFNTIHVQKEEELKILESKISKNKNDIATIKEFSSIHKNFDEEATDLADRHFRVYMAFPEKLNEENIIDFLKEAAAENNLEVLLLDSKDISDDNKKYLDKNSNKISYQTFKIKVKGDYFHLLDFVLELSNSTENENFYFFDIRNMYLNNQSNSENNLLTLDLEFNCYFSK